jgi:hypothetical protein
MQLLLVSQHDIRASVMERELHRVYTELLMHNITNRGKAVATLKLYYMSVISAANNQFSKSDRMSKIKIVSMVRHQEVTCCLC